MNDNMNKLLLLMSEDENATRTDRALYLLLCQFEDKLPELDDRFHKMFRQVDVIDEYPQVDMAIWHLLHESGSFWRCYDEVVKGEIDL